MKKSTFIVYNLLCKSHKWDNILYIGGWNENIWIQVRQIFDHPLETLRMQGRRGKSFSSISQAKGQSLFNVLCLSRLISGFFNLIKGTRYYEFYWKSNWNQWFNQWHCLGLASTDSFRFCRRADDFPDKVFPDFPF